MRKRGRLATLVSTALCLVSSSVSPQEAKAPDALYRDGVEAFRRGDIERSLEAFDALIALRPEQKAQLWQRGISLYYAGRLEECVAQFESHRTVNPDDAENATWHYLCVAALDGAEAARLRIFAARDSRTPLMAVHRLYAGTGSVDAVFVETTQRTDSFDAHLYVAQRRLQPVVMIGSLELREPAF